MTAAALSFKGSRSELIVIAGVVGILIVLFSPIPPALLDFLLITNFSFGLLILLLTFYMEKPLAFSTFPSVLLIATLFRLSLNVAATRLILSEAYAGKVIHAIGSHVVAGNYVVGLVVFAILIVVQFVVVTSGAQRVAEVAARFTLDAMPGKQMSIDADLNMGLITEEEARTRRREVEREANFYGAMDGASKFVKGDAVAGIIIILINIIGGLTIGLVQKGMGWSEALQTYTLLTVGDGIVTQIPALVIATGTGIIVTRAATDAQLTHEIIAQITRYPKSLMMVAVALLVALVLPGIPAIPVLVLLGLIGTSLFFAMRAARKEAVAQLPATNAAAADEQDLYTALKVDAIEVEIGAGLKALLGGDDGMLNKRLKAFRRQHTLDMGLVLQAVRVREEARRAPDGYAFRFFGATIAEGQIRPAGLLAINPGSVRTTISGEATRDPTFGLPALWISAEQGASAREAGYTVVDPVTVLLTHFTEVIRNQGYVLMTRQETERLVGVVRESQPSLVEELVPNVLSLSDIQKVLQALLKERVPVRNIELILEALAEVAKQVKDTDVLTERVREKLSLSICQRCTSRDGAIHVLTLDSSVDRVLRDAVRGGGDGQLGAALEPNWIDALVRALTRQTEAMLSKNLTPVLVCAPAIRRVLRRMVEAGNHHLNVISTAEISSAATVKAFAAVTLQ